MDWRSLIRDKRLPELARALADAHPRGLAGDRDALEAHLLERGASKVEAAAAAHALEQEGYAHHLPGARSRWLFSRKPIAFAALLRSLDQEYPEFVGEGDDDPREEALQFIGNRLDVDRAVAGEILTGLEAAGYASRVYSEAHQRDRILFDVGSILRV